MPDVTVTDSGKPPFDTDTKKAIAEAAVETWFDGLFDNSFDLKQYGTEDCPAPNKEFAGTSNERFIIQKSQALKGAAMVRNFAFIANVPTNWKVPEPIAEAFQACKVLYAIMLSVHWSMKNCVNYSEGRFNGHDETIADITKKLKTITGFVDTTREKLLQLQISLGNPDRPQEVDTTKYVKQTPSRSVARQHDRPARPAQGRQDSARKPFSLTALLASKRDRT